MKRTCSARCSTLKKISWTYIADYRETEYLEKVNLLVCYSGKRYVAMNIENMVISRIEELIPDMIKALKKDLKDERNERQVRRVRRHTARR